MNVDYFDEITDKLRKALNSQRYVHTLGVAFVASALAMNYGMDADRALVAGLLHDCAKCFSDEEKFRLCQEGDVKLSRFERDNPKLIHAKLGAYIAKRDYGVSDCEILKAIASHTTGEPAMTMLQKVVYIADILEPNRHKHILPDLAEVRQLAFKDTDECVYRVSKRQLEYLEADGKSEVDPMTRETYHYYRDIHDKKEAK